MTLEQGYFISQIFAALVLVASILFLALQVRQNSKLLEKLMLEDFRSGSDAMFDEIYRNKEFAEFHRKCGDAYGSLDETDKYRADTMAIRMQGSLLRTIRARLDGYVSDDEWMEVKAKMKIVNKRQNVRAMWEQIKDRYPKRIQDIWEEAVRT